MDAIINKIKIYDDSYSFSSDDDEKNILNNLSKINIFVGENNSGKSRFLRSIVKNKEFEFIPNNKNFKQVTKAISDLKKEIGLFIDNNRKLDDKYITTGNSNLKEQLSKIEIFDFIKPDIDYVKPVLELKDYIQTLEEGIGSAEPEMPVLISGQRNPPTISPSFVGGKLHEIFDESFKDLDEELKDIILFYEFEKIYIPILRGLRPLTENTKNDLYKDRTFRDYFSKEFSKNSLEESNIEVFSGLDSYHIVNKFSRGNHKERKLLEDFKNYLSISFFDGEKIEITATLDEDEREDVLTVKIGDEHEKPIYDLGDGLQSIIILTLQLFLHKNENLLVFIEEPEQYLHPGLQRKLIETFLTEKGFENFQFFFTTHSNHFLDITLDFDDISIYSVKKELDNSDNDEKIPSFTIENLSEGDTNALKLLGVRNSSVFLANCTIWVEGITDRHYLKHYLDLYKKEFKEEPDFIEFKEDYHYSFVEYGGNNITHWSFLDKEEKPINVEKLCGRLFLLADKDQGKEKRHQQLKETLGEERVHILECNEIENLVSPDVLLKILKDYEKIKDNEPLDNINSEFEYDQYKNEPLGSFIESEILKNVKNKKRKGNYKTESGTINHKDSFLKKSIKYSQNWSDLSPEAKKITKKIYNFIKENNS